MIYNSTYPVQNAQLSDYIKHYFLLDFSNLSSDNTKLQVPPVGYPVLQFHFGGEGNFYRHRHFHCQSLFIGQCTRHITLYPSTGMKLLGVNFKPYGLFNLLGISPRTILNSGVESSKLFGDKNIEHINQTLKVHGVEKGIAAIERLLIEYRSKTEVKQKLFDDMVDRLEKENGLINYTSIFDKNISRRTFQRYFSEVIGISPKRFCQIMRHKFIMEQLYRNPGMKWSDMLLNGFYYDFAHFTKDFTQFSGLSPKQYLPIKNSFALALLENG